MDFYNDLLNVYAYLQNKSYNSIAEADNLIKKHAKVKNELSDLGNSLEDLKEKAKILSRKYGFDYDPTSVNNFSSSYTPLKIPISSDKNYEEEFAKLLEEATAAGFTNTHPQDVLTEEELAYAIAYDKQLDIEFSRTTGLSADDIPILIIGIVLHLLRALFLNKQFSGDELIDSLTKDDTSIENIDLSHISLDYFADLELSPDMNLPDDFGKEFQNPDSKTKSIFDLVGQINDVFPSKHKIRIKSVSEIRDDTPSFILSKNSDKGSPLGFNKIWGWLAGVVNIMTDTVTYENFRTYYIPSSNELNSLSNLELSEVVMPFRNILSAFICKTPSDYIEEIVAAVIREAYILIPSKMQYENINNCIEQNEKTIDKLLKTSNHIGLDKVLKTAGYSSLVNTIIIALHGLFKSKEEDPQVFLLKTMKIITLSTILGSCSASLKAIITENPDDIDIGGLITAVVEGVSTLKFSINLKTQLVSEVYKDFFDKVRDDLDQYFEYI